MNREGAFVTTGYCTGASVVAAMPPPWASCGSGSGSGEAEVGRMVERMKKRVVRR